jgi:biopolymer transport protein ExbB
VNPRLLFSTVLLCLLVAMPLHADPQITNLDQLLENVREQQARQRALNRQREQAFLADRQRQQQLLDEARRDFEQRQQANQPLLAVTERNRDEIARLEKELAAIVDDVGDLSSTFREFAGDFAAALNESLLTAQFPGRVQELQALADADTQVSIEEVQALWLRVQEEMTASGKVTRFPAQVIDTTGATRAMEVLRAGPFTAWGDGDYLRYVPETSELLLLSRQPPVRYRDAARSFGTDSGPTVLAVDPTRGSLLGMLGYTPDLRERLEQGGTIGLIIIGLGALGLLLTLWRLAYLLRVSRSVRKQLAQVESPDPRNPLGRVLLAVQDFAVGDDDILLLKLDEAVLAELPALERGNGLIKLVAAISPLLGLLGTVTGMILTFQAISLFGTGDPKLMAGGISQALVTTVLGLVVAIPLLFGHSLVAYLAQVLVQRLDEQSAGVLARRVEQEGAVS